MFHVGQLVVCADDNASNLVFFDFDAPPTGKLIENGRIYTVREIGPARNFRDHRTRKIVQDVPVWLEEVVRNQGEWHDEPFGARRFRPVDERKIEIFTKMLEPVKEDA
jgi:hypothetical protein